MDTNNNKKRKERIIISDPVVDRYASLRLIDWWDQEKLSQAQVMVVGCGALGNEVLKNLAMVGVGKIFLVDFDKIEAANLTRSVLFRISDVGKRKVDVAAKGIKELNPEVQAVACHADIVHQVGLGIFRRMNVVISCLDNREARLAVNRNCSRVETPWVDGGLMVSSGQLRVFIPSSGPCYECTMTDEDYQLINQRYSCTGIRRENSGLGSVPTGTAISSIIGAMQAQEAIKFVHGMQVKGGEGITYNSLTRQFYPQKYQRKENCLGHDIYKPIIDLKERTAEMSVAQLLAIASKEIGAGAALQFDCDILTKLTCLNCKREEIKVKNFRDLSTEEASCRTCKAHMIPERTHRLGPETSLGNFTVAALGIPPLHIVGAKNGTRTCYFELGGDEKQVLRYR